MEKVEAKIIDLISHYLGVEKEEIKRSSHLYDDFNADKMSLADLYIALQEEFAVKIPPENFEAAKTVDDLIKIIEEYSNEFI